MSDDLAAPCLGAAERGADDAARAATTRPGNTARERESQDDLGGERWF